MRGAAIRGDILEALRRLGFPVGVVDANGVVVWQNDAMRRELGDRLGARVGERVVPEERRRFREAFVQSLLHGKAQDFEVSMETRNGIRRTEVSAAPLYESGRIVGVFGVLRPERRPAPPPNPRVKLTPRQRDVLAQLVSGCSTQEIAEGLGIAPETVRNHLRGIFRALGVHSRVQAVIRAKELGIVD
jgi:DNA-binding CsgD family transcriptional regulator